VVAAARRKPAALTEPARPVCAAAGRPLPVGEPAFLRACRRQPTEFTPIWLMRQAGRYMPEYRRVRAKHAFLELCKNPELAAEVTVTAARRLGVDAAIIFADILLVLEPMGMKLEFVKGDGPVLHNRIRTAGAVDRLRPVDPASLAFVFDAVRRTVAELGPAVPVIGFSGAPFTLASYMIEGGASRNYEHTKALMYREPGAFSELMRRLTDAVTPYLNGQIAAGATCVQVFDSWVGCLGPADYRTYVQPHMKRLFAGLKPDVPAIHFGTGNPALLEAMRDAGGDVIGVDFRIDLGQAWSRLGEVAVQGNLDPCALLADRRTMLAAAARVMEQAAGRPGHVFNLGHGILQKTPVDNVRSLVDYVHEYRLGDKP
jgi:uroporphyrinogen decarboxylase